MKKFEWWAVILVAVLILTPLFAAGPWPLMYEHWNRIGSNTQQVANVIALLTFVAIVVQAVVIGFQALVTRQQRILMDRQAGIMERQTLMQTEISRPHIVVVRIEAKHESAERLLLSVVWRNSGQIPPTDFRTVRHITTSDHHELSLGDRFAFGNNHVAGPLIGRDSEVKTDSILVFVGKDETEKPRFHDNWIFVWGQARYADRLTPGVEHRVEYCFRGHKDLNPMEFEPYGPYNRAYDAKQPKQGLIM